MTATGFPLMYYVTVDDGNDEWLLPGLGPDLSDRPYWIYEPLTAK